MKRKLIISIPIVIIALIQFIRIDTFNPEINANNDFLNVTAAPIEISTILKNTCYDCHSNQTKYPWYSNLAPVSWMLKNHINEGREHVNFSKWGDYSIGKQISLKEECVEEIQDNQMPLKSYTLIHTKAKLTSESKQMLVDWLMHSEQSNAAKK